MSRNKATTSRIMSAIRSRNTKPEILLGKAMWRLGLRYRKKSILVGKPDFVFPAAKVVVFCDGDFWHGNNWRIRGLGSLEEEVAGYSEFWRRKILRNVARDKEVNEKLLSLGWKVMRFWESAINKDVAQCAEQIASLVRVGKENKRGSA